MGGHKAVSQWRNAVPECIESIRNVWVSGPAEHENALRNASERGGGVATYGTPFICFIYARLEQLSVISWPNPIRHRLEKETPRQASAFTRSLPTKSIFAGWPK